MASTTIPLQPTDGWASRPGGGLVSTGPTDEITALIVRLDFTPGTPISAIELDVAAPTGGRLAALVTETPGPSPRVLAAVETDSAETLLLPVGRPVPRVGLISVCVQTNAAGAEVLELRASIGSAVRGV